ncbi:NRAMP family [Mucidula mucida]|nr:NRAMP family [Mucidula mucida]
MASSPPPSWPALSRISSPVISHVKSHIGVGIVCSVAYFDPGNWSVDLQAGSGFGYRPMLFVVLMAGFGAIIFQTLACKLGCVTGLDLAANCRRLLHDRPKHAIAIRRLVLYPLYVVAEVAIISTDLAELLGSAIGICLIFPKLPLWASVVITALDVLIFLMLSDPTSRQGRPARVFEVVIIVLVLGVFTCFVVLLVKIKPDWPSVFKGYIPSKSLFDSDPNAVYAAVGIFGSTLMPHGLYLGSFLATQDRESSDPIDLPRGNAVAWIRKKLRLRELFNVSSTAEDTAEKGKHENNTLQFIQTHLQHAITDVVASLFLLAVPINSAILIVAATVFRSDSDDVAIAGLFDAHALIKSRIGGGAAFVFALALVCAGQTSGITVTFAGQIVSEGFIQWRISPFLRRFITRSMSLIPSVVVAIAVGREGIDSLLVISQVILSLVLPFVALPLIWMTSSKKVMKVRVRAEIATDPVVEKNEVNTEQDFSNSYALAIAAYLVWLVMLIANVYALTILFRPQ